MSLSKKYGIPEATIKAMYMDGDLPSRSYKRDLISKRLEELITQGSTRGQAIQIISDETKHCVSYIYRLLE